MTRTPSFSSSKAIGPLPPFAQAVRLHEQGRLREAEQQYELVLADDKRHFGALHRLGLICLQQRRFSDAEHLFRRATKADKASAEAAHGLAISLTGLGRFEEAIKSYERVLAQNPRFAEAHNNLGHALDQLGRSEDAVTHYREATAIRPDYAEAHVNLADALRALGRAKEAMASYQRALSIRPAYSEASEGLGYTLLSLARRDEALAHFERALAANPDNAPSQVRFGKVLFELGLSERAISHFEKAIAVAPQQGEAHTHLGHALRSVGRLSEASRAFEAAIDLGQNKFGNFWNLANSRRLAADDRYFVAMTDSAREARSLGIEDESKLNFALGKALADQGEEEQSFRHVLRANALQRRRVHYDERRALDRLERIQEMFTADLMRERQGAGTRSGAPVFILGMPRSGSSLVEQILACHPRVHGAGELSDFARLAEDYQFPQGAGRMSSDEIRRLGEDYVGAIRSLAPSAECVTDKMPGNFAYAGLIHLALPKARIIHTCRDLRDTALSCFAILFTQGHEFTYDLAELGRYCRAYDALMEHWRHVIPPGVMLDVQYEELVGDLEPQARRIVAHCGLDWDDACLAFQESGRSVRTASASQVRQPVYRSSVGRWRRHAPSLQPLLQELRCTDQATFD